MFRINKRKKIIASTLMVAGLLSATTATMLNKVFNDISEASAVSSYTWTKGSTEDLYIEGNWLDVEPQTYGFESYSNFYAAIKGLTILFPGVDLQSSCYSSIDKENGAVTLYGSCLDNLPDGTYPIRAKLINAEPDVANITIISGKSYALIAKAMDQDGNALSDVVWTKQTDNVKSGSVASVEAGTKDGYTFVGWVDKEDLAPSCAEYESSCIETSHTYSQEMYKTTNIYAVYKQGTGGSTSTTKTIPTARFEYSTVTRYASDSAFFTNNFTTNSDGGITYTSSNPAVATVDYNDGSVTVKGVGTTNITATVAETYTYYSIQESYTLTVNASQAGGDEQQKPIYTLSFNSGVNDDSVTDMPNATTCSYAGNTCSAPIPSTKPSRTGYTFIGWSSTEGGAATYEASSSISLSADKTIYAVWSEIGGSGDDNPILGGDTPTTKITPHANFNPSILVKHVGDSPFTNNLITDSNGNRTYTSSNENVATVTNDGKVTINSVGTVTITVVISETDTYNSITTSYELRIREKSSNNEDNGENDGNENGGNNETTNNNENFNNNGSESDNENSNLNSDSATANDGSITYPSGKTYTIGSDTGLTVKINYPKESLEEVLLDGETLDEQHYTVKTGSTIITVKPSYLNTLNEGNHELEAVYNDGNSYTATFAVAKSSGPNSNSNSNNDEGVVVPNTSASERETGGTKTSIYTPDTGNNTNSENGTNPILFIILPLVAITTGLFFYFRSTHKSHIKFD